MPRHYSDDDYSSDSPPPRKSDRHREKDRDRDRERDRDRDQDKSSRRNRGGYKEEEIIEARGPPAVAARRDALIRRQNSDESIEEVRRDFPPGGDAGYARRSTRRARSDPRGRYDDYSDDDDDEYDDRRRRGHKKRDSKRGHRRRDYSSSESESPPRDRRKSMGEQALAALGVGGLAGAAAGGGRDRSRDRDRKRGSRRRHRSSSSSSSSRSRTRARSPGDQQKKIQQAVKAALVAGATEAFRSRKEPGGWGGAKGKRVLTAAIGAGGIDGIVNGDKDPDKKGMMHTIEAVVGGLAGNRLINGKRDRSASRTRSRDRHSDGGGGGSNMLEKILGAGAAAGGAKALLDRARSKSRGRRGDDSDDSRDARRPKRSKSVSDYARQGIAALGIGGDKQDSRSSRRDYDDDYRSRRGPPPREARLRGGGGEGGDGVTNSSQSMSHSSSGSDSGSNSDSDSVSSSEDERKHKKMRGREYLTAGLASVATIHAAHSVYQSIHARNVRRKEVKEGTISPEEARKKKNKARLQDAASIGIAAIGIKGAIGEWKEAKEHRDEYNEFEKERRERHERRMMRLERRLEEKNQPAPPPISHAHPIAYSQPSPHLAQGSYPQAVYQTGPYWNGPHYADGNPYAAEGLPLPPMGPQQQWH